MKYNLEISERSEYIFITVKGRWNDSIPEGFFNQISEIITEKSHLPVYFDLTNLEMISSIASDYFDAKKMADSNLFFGKKVAILDVISRKKHNDFFEIATQNRGLKVKFFYKENEAIEWLKK